MTEDKEERQPADSDYDGHVDFNALTPEQKLTWLAAIVILAKSAIMSESE